ncbi:MAG: TonB-dependent receptor [Proteobacteria bacterium]|nr:TonB-dependent receptor [Pseudomonadota bacterium]
MTAFRFTPLVAALLAATSAGAQSGAPTQTVLITGNPLAQDTLAQPASVLTGDALLTRRAATLGETLDGLPGVAATWFGPNANRPVIRGLDGDRVRVLDNAGASVDASSLSFDHAVAQDPLVAERIEVLRGPAALLYGGSALGGVVNTIDNRIPRAALSELAGRAEARLGGAARARSLSGLLEGGEGGLSWHIDGFTRRTDDLTVPRFTPPGEDSVPTTRVANSAAQAHGGAVGASWADARGYVGASVDAYRSDYGIVVEPEVTIQMRRDRLTLAGERELDGFFSKVTARAAATRYQHQELEGTEVGTTFKSDGRDARLELHHRPLGAFKGLVGVQAEALDFSALGEEAFVPDTRTRAAALFALEEVQLGALTLSGGLRLERARVAAAGDVPTERRFTPHSASLGAVWALGHGVSLSGALAHTERAPAYYELYADGLHVATGSYEQGDPSLAVERSHSLDAGVQWQGEGRSLRANVYAMRFGQYIALDATGAIQDEAPVYRFAGVPARLWGVELEGRQRFTVAGWALDATAGMDATRGENRATGEPLPRLAPLRWRLGLEAETDDWRLGASLTRAMAQTRVPTTDVATPGYTLVNLWVNRTLRWSGGEATLFARLDNAFDALAYSASSLRTARELAPLPARSLSAGAQLRW